VEVRLAGGREVHLRTMQPLALHLVNSIFLGDYLTSEGQAGQADLDMIADAGFEVEGAGTRTLPAHRADAAGCGSHESACGTHEDGGCGSAGGGVCGGHETAAAAPAAQGVPERETVPAGEPVAAGEPGPGVRAGLVAVRRRGAGTDLPPNA